MPKHTIRLYPKQAAFVGSSAHQAAFIGGIGSGKSTAGAVRTLLAAYGQIGTRRIPTPNLGMLVAPTYTMLQDASLRTLRDVAAGAVRAFNKSDMRLTFDNGSEVLLRSADAPDRLRGPNLSYAWLDEAALLRAEVWTIMLGRLRAFGQRGSIWATSTPRGRGWLYNAFVRDANADTYLVQAASADNVHLDPAVVAAWQTAYSGDLARQELEGIFVSYRGLVYDTFNPALHVLADAPATFSRAIAGVDFGYSNPGVMLVLLVDSDNRATLVHEAYETQRSTDAWLAVGQALHQQYGIERLYCDPAAPDAIQLFADGGLPAVPADHRVLPGIVAVQRRLVPDAAGVPGLRVHRSALNTLREFERYEWDAGADARPVKRDDHAMDALRYAVMGLDAPPRKPLQASVGRYV